MNVIAITSSFSTLVRVWKTSVGVVRRWRLYECVGAVAPNATSARSEAEVGAVGLGDEVDVLAVALHPVVDEGTEGEDGDTLLTGLVEREPGQAPAEPVTFEAVLDLGVDQRQ